MKTGALALIVGAAVLGAWGLVGAPPFGRDTVPAPAPGASRSADHDQREDPSAPGVVDALEADATETKMTAVKVRVGTTDPSEIAKISSELERHGVQVRHMLPALGIVTGDVSEEHVEALRALDWVDAVEFEATTHLPPMDSETPQ